jgi:hypothetical protein
LTEFKTTVVPSIAYLRSINLLIPGFEHGLLKAKTKEGECYEPHQDDEYEWNSTEADVPDRNQSTNR